MSGKSRLMACLRRQHWYGLVVAALEEEGIDDFEFVPPKGRGHPKLIAKHDGRTLKTPVPSSERGKGDHKYLVNRIRKFAQAS